MPLRFIRRVLTRLPFISTLGPPLPADPGHADPDHADPDHRGALLKRMPKDAHCAEIGVWKGDFSKRIIKITQPKLLHLVDPWMYQPQFPKRMYGGSVARNQEDMDMIFNEAMNQFRNMSNVKIHRVTSRQFFANIKEKLDWVYIDGNHSTEAVLEDLSLAWKRVRKSGIIAGDDYFWKDSDGSLSVKTAVDNFCYEHGCTKELVGGQYIIKRD